MKQRTHKKSRTNKQKTQKIWMKGGNGAGAGAGGAYKKLVCRATVNANDKVSNDSCLTKPLLMELRNEYNKDHPTDQIISTKPIIIWHELKTRLTQCDDDRCLLGEIDDVAKRKQWKQKLFAPEHPPEWLKNKKEWLSNHDIDSVMPQYEEKYANFKYLGTTSIDYDYKYSDGACIENRLCLFDLKKEMNAGKRRFASVFNLDKHTMGGSHWVTVYFDTEFSTIMFFDSARGRMPKQIRKFIKKVMRQGLMMKPKIVFDLKTAKSSHQRGDAECGVYAIYFIIEMLKDHRNLSRFINGHILDRDMNKERFNIFNSPSKTG
jgi:hypothetical protein